MKTYFYYDIQKEEFVYNKKKQEYDKKRYKELGISISKKFDMDISFEDLIKSNKTCKICFNSEHNFESYDGIHIFVTHPDSDEKFTIDLGVTSDGINYEGDYGCIEEYKEIPIIEGLKILELYRIMRNAKADLHNLLQTNDLM